MDGIDVGLPAHFHDEDQVTMVLAGRRRFTVLDASIEVGPGQVVIIPAGTAHASLHEPGGAHCLNAYLTPGAATDPKTIEDLLVRMVEGSRRCDARPSKVPHSMLPIHPGVAAGDWGLARAKFAAAAAARREGMSREGFSRMFRRTAGMPPHAYTLTAKLNCARDLLRQGVPVAAAAATAGFADQSHLGRCFRRAFGVTPGAYRLGS